MATVRGQSGLPFAIANDVLSLLTSRLSVSFRSDKKEARNKDGDVKAVLYYNNRQELSVEGIGIANINVAGPLTLVSPGFSSGQFFVDEVTIDRANEDFAKSTIKATHYTTL